jgi:hypothetical protein
MMSGYVSGDDAGAAHGEVGIGRIPSLNLGANCTQLLWSEGPFGQISLNQISLISVAVCCVPILQFNDLLAQRSILLCCHIVWFLVLVSHQGYALCEGPISFFGLSF